jgi:hypothetical protein
MEEQDREPTEQRFVMDAPDEIGVRTRYAFWLTTSEKRLLRAVRSTRCVARMARFKSGRILVEIDDSYDPDEAWHWIRTEIEDAVQYVELDPIWKKALWL